MQARGLDTGRPRPAAYEDYRAYLRAMIAHLKRENPRFSYRYFSRRAGYRSPNYLKLVADGARRLQPSAVGRFAKGLGLDDAERKELELLAQLDRAQTDDDRNRFYVELRRMAASDDAVAVRRDQYDLYSMWFATPIRELLLRRDAQSRSPWIARQLNPRVPVSDVTRALRLLQRLGLVAEDESGLRPVERKLKTPAQVPALAVRNFHRAMLRIAINALDALPVSKRNITSLTLNLSRSQYELVTQRIRELRAELAAIIEDSPTEEPQETYHLGFNVVPLTRSHS